MILMIENFRSGLIWSITRRSPYVATGLRTPGFQGVALTRTDVVSIARTIERMRPLKELIVTREI